MKSKTAKKTADEDETKSKKIRSSRGKRRRGRHSRSRSLSDSDSPARKRSKKKIADKKSKKNKGSSRRHRRRHRSLSPSRSPSSSPSSVSRGYFHRSRSTCHSSSSASERSVSPPPRSRSRDTRKGKGRGRDREKDRKRRRMRRSRSYSSSTASSGSSHSRSRSKSKSRKRRVAGTRYDANRDKIAQDYNNCRASRTEKNSIEDVDRDEEAVAVAKKGKNDIDGYEKNVGLETMESPPPSKDANETEEILPAGSGSPEAVDLELILRQKALENFRKFRGAAVMAGKTDNSGAGKEVVTVSLQNTVMKIAEARPAVTAIQRQGSSPGVSHSAGSPRLNDFGNGMSPLKPESSPGMSCGAGSPGILEAADTSSPIEQQGSGLEATLPTSQIRLQDGRNSGSVMQRLGSLPGSSGTVKQRLGRSAGVSHVNGTPKVRSVLSIPAREGLDGSTFITTLTASENSAPVESSSEVRHPPIETKKVEGTNGDDRKARDASSPNGSILSTAEGNSQVGIDGKDGSQFEKKTFSRMHDGETVQVSYKVYIPKKGPALARRKLQR